MKARWVVAAAGSGTCMIPSVFAHAGAASGGDTVWWARWNPDPLTILSLLALGLVYAYGLSRLMLQRPEHPTVRPRQVGAFFCGLLFLAVALVSPVDGLADDLQWMHMVQHMLLMNVAAPLVVMGAPWRVMLWTLPAAQRQLPGRSHRALVRQGVPRYLFWQPVLLLFLYAVVLWTWHVPTLYEAALQQRWVHDLQHVMFFAASCLFWRVLFDPIGRLQMGRGAAVLYLFVTSLHATVLGVLMAIAPRLWYPFYTDRTQAWGVSPLEDQQFAGYIMWMPACMIYALIAAVLIVDWLRDEPEDGNRVSERA